MDNPSVAARESAIRRYGAAHDIDRYVGHRLRQRRVMNGLTQQMLAELIGVTCQQAHKYENGLNRVSAGKLFAIAQALAVDIGYFFEGLGEDRQPPGPGQRVFLDHVRNFRRIRTVKHQEMVCALTRILADVDSAASAERDVSIATLSKSESFAS